MSELFLTCFTFRNAYPTLFKTKLTWRLGGAGVLQVAAIWHENLLKIYENLTREFIKAHADTCRLNIPKSAHIITCESIFSNDLQFEFGLPAKPTTKHAGQRSTGTPQLRPLALFVLHRQRRHLDQELHHLQVASVSCRVQRSSASVGPCRRDVSNVCMYCTIFAAGLSSSG